MQAEAPTRIVPEQYNPWNNSTNKSQAPEDGCINIRNMLNSKQWNKKASVIHKVGLSLFNYQNDARSNKHKIHLIMCGTNINTVQRARLYSEVYISFRIFIGVRYNNIYAYKVCVI